MLPYCELSPCSQLGEQEHQPWLLGEKGNPQWEAEHDNAWDWTFIRSGSAEGSWAAPAFPAAPSFPLSRVTMVDAEMVPSGWGSTSSVCMHRLKQGIIKSCYHSFATQHQWKQHLAGRILASLQSLRNFAAGARISPMCCSVPICRSIQSPFLPILSMN